MYDHDGPLLGYIEEVLKECDTALLYFGSHTQAVKAAYLEPRHEGFILFTTVNDEEIAIDAKAIIAVRGLAESAITGRARVL